MTTEVEIGTMRETVFLEDPSDVKLNVHQVMPDLRPEDRNSLKESIRHRGIINPILLDDDDAVVDGHNRIHCWAELLAEGVNVGAVVAHKIPGLDKYSAHEIAIETNVGRRQLSDDQKKDLIRTELEFLRQKYASEGYHGDQRRSWTTQRIADFLGVSRGFVRKVRDAWEMYDAETRYAHYVVALRRHRDTGTLHEHVMPRGSDADTPTRSQDRLDDDDISTRSQDRLDDDDIEVPEVPKVKVDIPKFAEDGTILSTTVRMVDADKVSALYQQIAKEAQRVKADYEAKTKKQQQQLKEIEKQYQEWFALRGQQPERPLVIRDREEWGKLLKEVKTNVYEKADGLMTKLPGVVGEFQKIDPGLIADAIRARETGDTYARQIAQIAKWCEGVKTELETQKKNPLRAVE